MNKNKKKNKSKGGINMSHLLKMMNDVYAFGGEVGDVPVEVEGDEVGETPKGTLIDFEGPSHEEGGIDVNLPEGTEIFSDRIKVKGKTMAERKTAREKKKTDLEKLLSKNSTDTVLKNTLKRTIKNNDIEEASDQELQEMISEMKKMTSYAFGTGKKGVRKKFALGSTGIDKSKSSSSEAGFLDNLKNFFGGIETPNLTGGDALALAGTAFSSFSGARNTEQNRAGSTPNINAFENYGKSGLETLDSSKDLIASQEARALRGVQDRSNAAMSSNRNSSRGVNTMRALDIATTLGANEAEGNIYDNFSKQMLQVLSQQAGFENQQDQIVMGGEQGKDLADRQDRDAYFTNRGEDFASQGEGIARVGKMMNQNKRNTVAMQAVNNSSANYMYNSKGQLTDKNGTPIDPVEIAKLQKEADAGNFDSIEEYLASKNKN